MFFYFISFYTPFSYFYQLYRCAFVTMLLKDESVPAYKAGSLYAHPTPPRHEPT